MFQFAIRSPRLLVYSFAQISPSLPEAIFAKLSLEIPTAMLCSLYVGSCHEANALLVDVPNYVDYVHY
jgi:hypothetical protein